MKDNKGFTLLELLIVVAIMGIIAVGATTAYIGAMRKAARAEAYAGLQSLRLLEEQFFAENARYTNNQGAAGNTVAIRDLNRTEIQTVSGAGDDALPGFRPSADATYSYRIIQNVRLPANPGVPFNAGTVINQNLGANPPEPQCFVAIAEGLINTRVTGDVFAIDCFNNKNF